MTTPTAPASAENPSDDRLVEHWMGKTAPEERERIETWFKENPEQHARLEQLYEEIKGGQWTPWSASTTTQRTVTILQAVDILSEESHASVASPRRSQSRWNSSRISYLITGLIASVIVLVMTWQYQSNDTGMAAVSRISTYTTGKGERATVLLPDGSTVVLNVASRLEVPFDYARGNRAVVLDGEALFTVVHRRETPFTVTTKHSVTRVLGTSFIVRHYQSDTAGTVAVRDGKVAVGNVVVSAGEETYMSATGVAPVQTARSNRFNFSRGVLTLESMTLADAIPDLNRWFNAEIQLGDSALGQQRISGDFEAGSLTDLIWILELTFNIRVVCEGRILTIYPKG